MRLDEASTVIKTVLRGLWPQWEPTDEQRSVWIKQLLYAEFEPTCQAIRTWFSHCKHPGLWPILGLLIHHFVYPKEPGYKEDNEPLVNIKGSVDRAFYEILTGPEERLSKSGRMVKTKAWLENFLLEHPDMIPKI
jgi:hypothetical protein